LALSTVTGGSNAIIQGVGQTLTNVDNTIAGTGNIGNSAPLAVTNGGTIEATPAGGTSTLTLSGNGGLANNGTFAANNGGTLTATVPFTNTATVHAINGTINADAGSVAVEPFCTVTLCARLPPPSPTWTMPKSTGEVVNTLATAGV